MFGMTKTRIIATALITLFGSSTLCSQDIKPIQVELPADPSVVQPLRKLIEAVSANNSRIRSLEAGTGVTQPAEIEVELRLKPDQSSERVERLIEDLSGFGITRFRLAGPFENQNMVMIGAPEETPWIRIHELTVFLKHQRGFKFDIRMRPSDKLPTSTQSSESEEIEATLLKLDELPARGKLPLGRNTPESQKTISDTPNGSSAVFRGRLTDLEEPVLQLAEQVRMTEKSRGKDHPESVKHRSELRSQVQQTFAARQEIQRAELAEFTRRLEHMQQSIDARDRIAEKIVDQRVEELLNPELSWEQVGVKRSAPDVLPTFAQEGDPATSLDRAVPAANNPDSSAGITVTVPVSSGHHLIGELKEQIGHDRINLPAEKVPATTSVSNQGPSSNAVATKNAVATETTSNESSENSATVSTAGPTNTGVTPELSPSVTGVVANRELLVTEVSSALPGEPRSIELLIAEKTFRREKNSSAIRVTYDDIDLLKVLNMEPVPIDAVQHFPSWLKSLDGTTIRIRGFMYPTFQATGLTELTLARDNGICCFVRRPKIYDIIAVELAAGVTSDYIEGKPFDVEGVFRIRPEADETELYRLYRIENARVLR